MKLDNNRLKAFFQVALDKNFHIAAERLCVTQSALSQRILKLEQELKVTLLVRNLKGVSLTEAGIVLFEHARNLKALEMETLELIADQSSCKSGGALKIAAYSSILRSAIIPALESLIGLPKDTYVEFFSRELRDLPTMLKNSEVDFILLDYDLKDDTLNSLEIGREELIHVKRKDQLEEHLVFLDHDAEDRTSYDFFKEQDLKSIVKERRFYDDIYGVIDGVMLGLGQAIVSKHLIAHLDALEIVSHRYYIFHPVILYYLKNRCLSKFHQEVIHTLQRNTEKHLDTCKTLLS